MQYKTTYGESPGELDTAVNHLVGEGWRPSGGVTVHDCYISDWNKDGGRVNYHRVPDGDPKGCGTHVVTMYFQAMVKVGVPPVTKPEKPPRDEIPVNPEWVRVHEHLRELVNTWGTDDTHNLALCVSQLATKLRTTEKLVVAVVNQMVLHGELEMATNPRDEEDIKYLFKRGSRFMVGVEDNAAHTTVMERFLGCPVTRAVFSVRTTQFLEKNGIRYIHELVEKRHPALRQLSKRSGVYKELDTFLGKFDLHFVLEGEDTSPAALANYADIGATTKFLRFG
jgi:hypothetical protein